MDVAGMAGTVAGRGRHRGRGVGAGRVRRVRMVRAAGAMSVRSVLAVLVLCAGGLSAYVGTPQPPLADDEVSAEQLARWIRARHPGLQLLDTRGLEAMQGDMLPGAFAANDVDAHAPGDIGVIHAQQWEGNT